MFQLIPGKSHADDKHIPFIIINTLEVRHEINLQSVIFKLFILSVEFVLPSDDVTILKKLASIMPVCNEQYC